MVSPTKHEHVHTHSWHPHDICDSAELHVEYLQSISGNKQESYSETCPLKITVHSCERDETASPRIYCTCGIIISTLWLISIYLKLIENHLIDDNILYCSKIHALWLHIIVQSFLNSV